VPASRDCVQTPYTSAMDAFRIVVVMLLAAIVSSLAIGLFHLSSGKGDSKKMLRALSYRIGLSLVLFLLLMLAWRMGWIAPNAYSSH
jgi:uncharacterized membrane protein